MNLTAWQNEVWYEQGVAYFYSHEYLNTNGYVLFGQFLIQGGSSLPLNSYLLAGIQTISGRK